MHDAESELHRRRARATVAQRRFRQRQSKAAQNEKIDHERLRSLVVDIVEASLRDDATKLNLSIIEAAEAVNINLEARRDVPSSRRSPKRSEPERSLRQAKSRLDDLATIQAKSVKAQSSSTKSGRMSPRFGYGAWLEPYCCVKIEQPPVDIAPYVGIGEFTIAGQVSWACLEYGYACLQEALASSDESPIQKLVECDGYPDGLSASSPEARRMFDVALRHSKTLHDIQYMRMLLAARIEFRRLGYMRKDSGPTNIEPGQELKQIVHNDLLERGLEMDQWWTALRIERYIAHKMGLNRFSVLETGLAQQGKWLEWLMPLAQSLAKQSVCFGDGPRWRADHVSMLADVWIETCI